MPSPSSARTDRHNNPAAITTDLAHQGGLIQNTDYTQGDPFTVGSPPLAKTYYTARLIGDPIALTIRVIDHVGYYTKTGGQRWTYIALPDFVWSSLTPDLKLRVIGFHYAHEGGTEMAGLFPG